MLRSAKVERIGGERALRLSTARQSPLLLSSQCAAVGLLVMASAGSIRIDLRYHRGSGQVRSASIALHRPDVAPLLLGRTPLDAANLVGRLHSVCGAAHRLAALRAIAAASRWEKAEPLATLADRVDPRTPVARQVAPPCRSPAPAERAVLLEMTFEHLVRLFVDWPSALGLPAQPAMVLDWRRRMRGPDARTTDDDIQAVVRHGKNLQRTVPDVAGTGRRLRRRLREAIACLVAAKFAGRCPRQARAPLVLRPPCVGAARPEQAPPFGRFMGEGRARTARGELIHRVMLERAGGGRFVVVGWSIDAPTDRMFVDDGPVTSALRQVQAGEVQELRRLAEIVVLSFDPCFECRMELSPAEETDA